MIRHTLLTFLLIFACATQSTARESGPGNGTSYVKILFADAQLELSRRLGPLDDAGAQQLQIGPVYKTWLAAPAQSGVTRFGRLKYFVRAMELRFQLEPCTDASQLPASICFFNDATTGPYVMISLEQNAMTTREQAMAMLIHEAGHFVGEKDHLFLDKLGVQMVASLRAPRLFLSDVESLEISDNPFEGKKSCDDGSSAQAQTLKQEALLGLRQQCLSRQATCDVSKAQLIYRGEPHWVEGVGYDMKVLCRVRAVLELPL